MEAKLSAGLWRTTITPPLDGPIVGGVDPVEMESIQDDLYANALVLDDGEREVAIVSLDVIGLPYEIVTDILAGVERCCGIPSAHVTLSATHTHNGPRLYTDGSDSYTETLKKLVVTAVYMAKKRKQPARIGVGRGENRDYVFNRRLKKPDGSIVMNWVDRDYVQDCTGDGPVDPEMLVLKIEGHSGQPLGFVVNYANHNNAVPLGVISANISGYMGRLLRSLYGDDLVTIFLLGACGNVNWLEYRSQPHRECPTHYQDIATSLSGTALQILPRVQHPDIDEIQSASETLQIRERPFEPYDTQWDTTYGLIDGEGAKAFFEHMHGRAKADAEGKELRLRDVNLHALRIGDDIAIATFPCELFVEYGLEIKARSPFKYTLVAELTNGSEGYVPTLQAYEEGGYEVRKPANRLEKDAGERMTAASLALLAKLAE